MADLDRSRRYLKPVPRLALPDEPDDVHLALYGWEDRFGEWVTSSPALCGSSAEQGDLPMDAEVTCPGCLQRQPQYGAVLARETRDHADSRRTVEYFVQCQQPDGTWEQCSSTATDLDFATERLAARRRMQPEFEYRITRRTTTVVVEPLDAAPDCAECGHAQDQHTEADEPVSVGQCLRCAEQDDDESWHDYEPMAAQ